jgi:hypothetical protein
MSPPRLPEDIVPPEPPPPPSSPPAAWVALLVALCRDLGFDHAAYTGRNAVEGTSQSFATYPAAWQEHYEAEGYREIDPTVVLAARSVVPVDWRRLAGRPEFRRIWDEGRWYGIRGFGLTVPVRGPYGDVGLISVRGACPVAEWAELIPAVIADLQTRAGHLHNVVLSAGLLSGPMHHPVLSRGEKDSMTWAALGTFAPIIGRCMGLSARTMETYLQSARDKLSATSAGAATPP